MENANALIVDAALIRTSGTAEREAALAMLGRHKKARRITLGADKAYDVAEFVDALRERAVTPHIAVGGHLIRNESRTIHGVVQRIDKSADCRSAYAERCGATSASSMAASLAPPTSKAVGANFTGQSPESAVRMRRRPG